MLHFDLFPVILLACLNSPAYYSLPLLNFLQFYILVLAVLSLIPSAHTLLTCLDLNSLLRTTSTHFLLIDFLLLIFLIFTVLLLIPPAHSSSFPAHFPSVHFLPSCSPLIIPPASLAFSHPSCSYFLCLPSSCSYSARLHTASLLSSDNTSSRVTLLLAANLWSSYICIVRCTVVFLYK
jgi:hypothetical protein